MSEPVNDSKNTSPNTPKSVWPLLVTLVLVAGLAAAAVIFLGGNSGQREEQAASAAAGQRGQEKEEGAAPAAEIGHPSLGDEDAPVTMVEYADFQCPFCGKFARDTEPELIEKYVEDGTLRIEWRDFPYLGQESANAAFAARAAQAQGEFWRYHELLYGNQGSVNSGDFSDEKLIEFAREAGVDVDRFERDMKGGKYEGAVAADFEEGQGEGVTGTPTFVINGKTLVGAQPQDAFEKAIEDAAREAQDG